MNSGEFIEYYQLEDFDTYSPGGANTSMPFSYIQAIHSAVEYHIPSDEEQENEYLSAETCHELTASIQTGITASRKIQELKTRMDQFETIPDHLTADYFARLREEQREGKVAQDKLVECYLPLAVYLAYLSMDMPPEDNMPTGRNVSLRFPSHTPWQAKNITSLRSKHAILDDRIQVANETLVKATATFTPETTAKDEKLTTFDGYAIRKIKDALRKHVRSGDELPLPKRREIMPLHELYICNANPEEQDSPYDEPPILHLTDILVNTAETEVVDEVALSSIRAAVLEILGADSAAIMRMRYGLDYTQAEVAEAFGISATRVHRIVVRSRNKLLRSSAGIALLDNYLAQNSLPGMAQSHEFVRSKHKNSATAAKIVVSRSVLPTKPT